MTIKTIDIQAKEWFDKSAGNSYFSAEVDVKFTDNTRKLIKLPFQYGYETQYIHQALKALQDNNIIPKGEDRALWRYCSEHGIELTTHIKENCTLKEVKQFGNA